MRQKIDFDELEKQWHEKPGFVFGLIAVLLALFFYIPSAYDDYQFNKRIEQLSQKKNQITNELSQSYAASLSSSLDDDLMTKDVENHWLNKRVIMSGEIIDIANYDDKHYLVTVDDDTLRIKTLLNLSLIAEKKLISEGLDKEQIVVVASIESVTSSNTTRYGFDYTLKTGHGNLIDIRAVQLP